MVSKNIGSWFLPSNDDHEIKSVPSIIQICIGSKDEPLSTDLEDEHEQEYDRDCFTKIETESFCLLIFGAGWIGSGSVVIETHIDSIDDNTKCQEVIKWSKIYMRLIKNVTYGLLISFTHQILNLFLESRQKIACSGYVNFCW